MKALFVVLIASLSFAANAANYSILNQSNSQNVQKSNEPAPPDRDQRRGGGEPVDPHQETYEGNDRSGEVFDGGGYSGSGGGMGSEIFFTPNAKTYPVTTSTRTEEIGDIVIYTTTVHEDISAEESCTMVTKMVVEKTTGKVLSTDTKEYCNHL